MDKIQKRYKRTVTMVQRRQDGKFLSIQGDHVGGVSLAMTMPGVPAQNKSACEDFILRMGLHPEDYVMRLGHVEAEPGYVVFKSGTYGS